MNLLLRPKCEDRQASERWENEGGPIMSSARRDANTNDSYYRTEDNLLTLLPPFEHKEPADDDCGLPENPIYTNYSKYMWTTHKRTGGVQVKGVDDRTEPKSK